MPSPPAPDEDYEAAYAREEARQEARAEAARVARRRMEYGRRHRAAKNEGCTTLIAIAAVVLALAAAVIAAIEAGK